jgi:hypothetical protein
MGTFYALVGGKFTQKDMENFRFLDGKLDYESTGQRMQISERLLKHAPYFRISETDTREVEVEIDRTKDNQRILRETLDRMRKEDGNKVVLDAFYRKKIVEYANVLEDKSVDMDKKIWSETKLFSELNNRTLFFERNVYSKILEAEDVELEVEHSPVYNSRDKILLHFRGKTLEEIYASLDADDSGFARRCAAVMRTRDQNLLRANLHLVRQAVNSSFSECLMNEFRMTELITRHPHLCPRLFQKACRSAKVFDPTFAPDMVQIVEDDHGKIPFEVNLKPRD